MISIVYTHWAMSEERSAFMRRSIISLIESAPDQEILVADNGGSLADSEFLLKLCEEKKISVYVRFRENTGIAIPRNTLLDIATQPFIAIVDNDIVFEKGWWEECTAYLTKNPDLVATPLVPDVSHRTRRYWVGERDGWQLNSRAGSPCFVMARSLFLKVGKFQNHNVCGSKYADALTRNAAFVAIMPQCKAVDIGERRGYNWRNPTYTTKL